MAAYRRPAGYAANSADNVAATTQYPGQAQASPPPTLDPTFTAVSAQQPVTLTPLATQSPQFAPPMPNLASVGRGDSVASIARNAVGPDASEYDVEQYAKQILAANGVARPESLQAGALLTLPTPGSIDPAAGEAAWLASVRRQAQLQYQAQLGARQAAAADWRSSISLEADPRNDPTARHQLANTVYLASLFDPRIHASAPAHAFGEPVNRLPPNLSAAALSPSAAAGLMPSDEGRPIDWEGVGKAAAQFGADALNLAKVGALPATAFASALAYGGGMDPDEDARFQAGVTAADARRAYENNLIDSWEAASASDAPDSGSDRAAVGPDTMGTPQGPDDPNLGDDNAGGARRAQRHHILTPKNRVASSGGGPWTPIFERMAEDAGMTLEDVENTVDVVGHQGRHPAAYHQLILNRLRAATTGLSGEEYSQAFRTELQALKTEAMTPGSDINNLITKK